MTDKISEQQINNELDLKSQRELNRQLNQELFTVNDFFLERLASVQKLPCFDCEHCTFKRHFDVKITGYCQHLFEVVFSTENKDLINGRFVSKCVEHERALKLQ